jgi:hypothetical protein
MYFLVKGRTEKGITLPFVDDEMKYWHNLSTTPKHFKDGICLSGQRSWSSIRDSVNQQCVHRYHNHPKYFIFKIILLIFGKEVRVVCVI